VKTNVVLRTVVVLEVAFAVKVGVMSVRLCTTRVYRSSAGLIKCPCGIGSRTIVPVVTLPLPGEATEPHSEEFVCKLTCSK